MADKDKIAADVELNLKRDAAEQAMRKFMDTVGYDVENMSKAIQAGLVDFGEDFSSDEISAALDKIKDSADKAGDSTKKAGEEVSNMGRVSQVASGYLSNLANMIKQSLVVTLGMLGYNAIMKAVDAMKEAVVQAEEFSKAVYKLEVAVRALQRSGVDTTFSEVWKDIQNMRKEFSTFSTKDLVEGRAQMLNLTRELELGMGTVNELIEASATLAIVSGRNINEAQRMIAMASSSGYTEGLQQMGIAISRTSIALKAQAMGLGESYNALTENERALATTAIVLEQVGAYAEDATLYTKSYAGSIDESKAELEDLKTELGQKFLPLWSGFLGLLVDFLNLLENVTPMLLPVFSSLQSLGIGISFVRDALEALFSLDFSTPLKSLSEWWGEVEERAARARKEIQRIYPLVGGGDQIVPDIILGDEQVATIDETYSAIEETIGEHLDSIETEITDYNDTIAELTRDLQRDLEKMNREYQRDVEKAARDHARKLEDIDRDYYRDVAKAGRNYQQSLASLEGEQRDKIAELAAKYRDKEIEAEAKHAEELRKLRSKLLFDVEEAARVRDAAQARRAVREYRMNKENQESSFNLEKENRARDYARQIQELRNAESQKRRELQISYQQKLEDLKIQREVDRAEALIAYEEDLEDLKISLAAQREERMIAYRQDLEDQARAWEARLRNLASALAEEYGMTVEAAKAVAEVYAAVYGRNGVIDQIMREYMAIVKQAGNTSVPVPGSTSPDYAGAQGGTFMVSKPTLLLTGENGAERVDVTPINYRGANEGKVFGDLAGNYTGKGMSGKMFIEVALSPDLEARVVKKSTDEMSNALVNIARRKM